MNNSSAQTDYLTISSDVGIIAQEVGSAFPDTITLTSDSNMGSGSTYFYTGTGIGNVTIGAAGPTYTIASGGSVTIDSISASSFNWKMPEEFVDSFPDYDRIQNMCKEYPGLAIAFEKFKTVYNLVKDHYDTPEDQRPKP